MSGKKSWLFLLILAAFVCLAASGLADVPLTEKYFPDAQFREVLSGSLYDRNRDGVLSSSELSEVTSISCHDKEISSLKGIEYFTELTYLSCASNQLTTLDLSKNTKLTDLYCYKNQLTGLDLSKNTKLDFLNCFDNQLASLDVSKCTELTHLYGSGNQLTGLDVSKSTKLTHLDCSRNLLTSLDVSANTALNSLGCGSNQLTHLDVSANTALTSLQCGNNQLTLLDVSANTALTSLGCGSNQLTHLDVSRNYDLTSLSCNYNQLTSLDVADHTKLKTLCCDHNQLKKLELSSDSPLYQMLLQHLVEPEDRLTYWAYYLRDEQNRILQCLTYDKAAYLVGFVVEVNPGVALDAAHFPDDNFRAYIVDAGFDQNGDKFLSAKELENVTSIWCENKKIRSLKGIEYFTNLIELGCAYNQLTSLDIRKNTKLTYLDVYMNKLKSLNLSHNTELADLECDHNQLSELDFSKNTKLQHLYCSDNKLKTLDVSPCPCLVKVLKAVEPDDHETYWQFVKKLSKKSFYVLAYDKTVRVKPFIKVTSLSLSKTKASITMTLDKKIHTLNLEASFLPLYTNPELTWKSSNTKVAEVLSSGRVFAIGPGTCKITVTAKDSSGKKAVCVLTVTEKQILYKGLKFDLNLSKKTATVIGAEKTSIKQVKVPSTVKANGQTYTVTAIGNNAFKGLKSLTSFSTGENLTTIGKSAFENCVKLKKIIVESSKIKKIGKNAFKNIAKKPSVVLGRKLATAYTKKVVRLLISGGIKAITQIIK